MSFNNWELQDSAHGRRRDFKNKPYAKRAGRRLERRKQSAELITAQWYAAIELRLVPIHRLDQKLRDAFDFFDEVGVAPDDCWFHDPGLFSADPEIDRLEQRMWEQEQRLYDVLGEDEELPADVVGGLPDWMLDQVASYGGHAMHLQALFETKPAVRRPISSYEQYDHTQE